MNSEIEQNLKELGAMGTGTRSRDVDDATELMNSILKEMDVVDQQILENLLSPEFMLGLTMCGSQVVMQAMSAVEKHFPDIETADSGVIADIATRKETLVLFAACIPIILVMIGWKGLQES